LISAYVTLVRGFVNVKPFEAIVRYGVPLIERNDLSGLGRLLRASLAIDLASALAGTLIAIATALAARDMLGWDAETAHLAAAYSCILLTSGYAAASGVLRIYDRFDCLSQCLIVSALWRVLGLAGLVAWYGQPGVAAVAAVWASAEVVQYLGILYYGWRVARARIPREHLRGPLEFAALERAHPDLRRFFNVVYWQSTLDLVPKSFGTLYAGVLLGAEGAAMYRIARNTANVIAKPALLVRQAVYPDLARLHHHRDDNFGKLVVSMGLFMGVPALALALASVWLGRPLLELVLGAAFVPAAPLLTWLAFAATLELAAAPLRPAGYALGRGSAVLAVQVVCVLAFIAAFQILTPRAGLEGPGIAAAIMACGLLIGTAMVVRRGASA